MTNARAAKDSTPIAHFRASDQAIQTVAEHLLGVAEKTRRFASKCDLADQGELVGLLHDLGKYSGKFQAYIRSGVGILLQEDAEFVDPRGNKGKIDHSSAGAHVAWRTLATSPLGSIVGQMLALCVASHHSGLIDCLTSDDKGASRAAFRDRMDKSEADSHTDEAMVNADREILSRLEELLSKPELLTSAQSKITRIVLSNQPGGDRGLLAQIHLGFLIRFLFSCLIDADRLDTSDFDKPHDKGMRSNGKYVAWPVLCSRLDKALQGMENSSPINDLRQEISSRCLEAASRPKGIYSLTVPTGGGKTRSSLRFALNHARLHGMDRVIYFIPFTSIIDQNAADVRGILETADERAGTVVLEHHSNLTHREERWQEAVLSQSWDAPVVFTTNVQFLETMFGGGTRGARRMHQMANAVLIFDEVQTVPVNCVHLFNNAINFLVEQCGSTVVLCTATQPLLDHVDASKGALKLSEGAEIIRNARGLFDRLRRVEVVDDRKEPGWSYEEIIALALEEIAQTGSCLVVVNTRAAARALSSLCRSTDDLFVSHLSTFMCPAHRRKVLAQTVERLQAGAKKRVLCFSTQLIEAGVDIDFGSVIRFAAGLDSIAQAAGRCNRHGLRKIGRVHVVNPLVEDLDMLPEIHIGREQTLRLFGEFKASPDTFGGSLIGPEAMERFYRYYFFERRHCMDYPVSAKELGRDDTLLSILSNNGQALAEYEDRNNARPDFYFRQSFMAAGRAFKAIDSITQGVIVPFDSEGKDIIASLSATRLSDPDFRLLQRAQQFSVSLFPHVLEKLIRGGAVRELVEGTGILSLDARYYSKEFGLSESPVEDMEVYIA